MTAEKRKNGTSKESLFYSEGFSPKEPLLKRSFIAGVLFFKKKFTCKNCILITFCHQDDSVPIPKATEATETASKCVLVFNSDPVTRKIPFSSQTLNNLMRTLVLRRTYNA